MIGDEPSVKKEEEEEDELSDEEEDNEDPGWTWEANIPDTCWLSGDTVLPPEAGTDEEVQAEGQSSDDDSADSDFDSDEVLSGDEGILATGRRWLANQWII
jgi:hypothetical protein